MDHRTRSYGVLSGSLLGALEGAGRRRSEPKGIGTGAQTADRDPSGTAPERTGGSAPAPTAGADGKTKPEAGRGGAAGRRSIRAGAKQRG